MMLTDEKLAEVRGDIASFALTGTPIELRRIKGSEAIVSWVQGKHSRETHIRLNAGELQVKCDENVWLPYRHYLASESMSDLRFLALQIIRNVKRADSYFALKLQRTDDEDVAFEPEDVLEALSKEVREGADQNGARTEILFLRGAAGCGKSVSLREFARRQAEAFLIGKAETLCLYIDAQGKSLISLHDAFSSILDDLSITSVRKDTIAPLCRYGLLVPLVDGFDELLGAGGYGDAFNSLVGFLSELKGHGMLIASGRSTFYDQQYLQITASRQSEGLDYHTTTARMLSWNESRIREYCHHVWKSREDRPTLDTYLDRLLRSRSNEELLGKPFFTAEMARLVPAQGYDPDLSLIQQLVTELIRRETEKLKDRAGMPVLSANGHMHFLCEVAHEMWWSKTIVLDADTIMLIAEDVANDLRLPLENRRQVVERSVLHGVFESERHHRVHLRFQHPVYFDFFLEQYLLGLLRKGDPDSMRAFLEKGILSESFLELFAQTSNSFTLDDIKRHCDICSLAMKPGGRYQVARQNAGALIAAMLNHRECELAGLSFKLLEFHEVDLCNVTLRDSSFTECNFVKVRMFGLVLENCHFVESRLERIELDEKTRLAVQLRVEDVIGVLSTTDGNQQWQYEPAKIAKILGTAGAQLPQPPPMQYTPQQLQAMATLDRFLRRMERSYYFSEDLEYKWGLPKANEWSRVKSLLYKHRLMIDQTKEIHGHLGVLQVLSRTPEQIRQGQSAALIVDQAIRDFWDEI